MEGKITISKKLFYRLKIADFELDQLNGIGVDNWPGIEYVDYDALDKFKAELKQELDSPSLIEIE